MVDRTEIPITEDVMKCARIHMRKERPWRHGNPVKAYLEKDGRISITYEDFCWWFYRASASGLVWE